MSTTLTSAGSLILVTLVAGASPSTQPVVGSPPAPAVSVIPKPVAVESPGGLVFVLSAETRFAVRGAVGAECLTRVVRSLNAATGLKLNPSPVEGDARGDAITLRLDESIGRDRPEWQAAEAYRLTVAPDGNSIVILAANAHGFFNAAQTLVQLLQKATDGSCVVKPVRIDDYPRFQWRGYLLDPARHFRPKAEILRYIDLLALHKLNVLQLHLTDDQGWRIEIKKYPKLVEVGARLPDCSGRRGEGWFYTQADIKEIVAYAADRYVMVLPEIEMPGHSGASTASYPEFGCEGKPASELCVANPAAFEFATHVLDEVATLFPSPFVHIGADEVAPERWRACPLCSKRMKELADAGLPAGVTPFRVKVTTTAGRPFHEDIGRLEGDFVRRIDAHLAKIGKRMLGWDEVLDGGLADRSRAAVTAWRSDTVVAGAAAQGRDVVVSVYPDYYLDNDTPLAKTYAVEPAPSDLPAAQAGHVLGLQGNMWGEMTPKQADVDKRTFPRLCALAEVAWTPRESRQFDDFLARLSRHAQRLQTHGIAFSVEERK